MGPACQGVGDTGAKGETPAGGKRYGKVLRCGCCGAMVADAEERAKGEAAGRGMAGAAGARLVTQPARLSGCRTSLVSHDV